MYESPIRITLGKIKTQMVEQQKGETFRVLQECSVSVDEEELKKALNYDRQQYEKGYMDAKAEQQWIPCSERLPERSGRYLVCALDGTNRRITVVRYLQRCKAWTMAGRTAYWKVIAWMPLPEPYKEGRQE